MSEQSGHNAIDAEKLNAFVDRLVTLEQEKRHAAELFRDVIKEAENVGYEAFALRWLVKSRMQDRKQREEAERRSAVIESYAFATQAKLPF